MKRLIFELSMPNVGSWNGRWSGEQNKYTVARKFTKKQLDDTPLELGVSYYYNFGDGWGASIEVREALPREKATNRFCGYEWMINSIIKHGLIKVPSKG